MYSQSKGKLGLHKP